MYELEIILMLLILGINIATMIVLLRQPKNNPTINIVQQHKEEDQ